jgi:hypothetical protein
MPSRFLIALAVALLAPAGLGAQEPAAAAPAGGHEFVRPEGRTAAAPGSATRNEWMLVAGLSALVLVAAGLQVWAKARGGVRPTSADSLRVTGRVGLTSRHAIYTVSAGGKSWLVGVGPQGPPSLLAEVPGNGPVGGGEG